MLKSELLLSQGKKIVTYSSRREQADIKDVLLQRSRNINYS